MPNRRRCYAKEEREELWRRWKLGDRITDIAAALERGPGSLFGHLRASGGIQPRKRTRNARVLSIGEREAISRGVSAGLSLREIAAEIGRAPSTVCREIARNGGASEYRAVDADQRAREAAKRPQSCKLACRGRLRRQVAAKLARNWSPEQIAGWLRLEHPDDASMRISHGMRYRKDAFRTTRGSGRAVQPVGFTGIRSRSPFATFQGSSAARSASLCAWGSCVKTHLKYA